MTRPLTEAMQNAAASSSAAPINILRIEFEGQTGDRFYSDRDLGQADGASAFHAQGRVTSWGRIAAVLAEQTATAVADCVLELADGDGTLKSLFDAVEFQRKRVTVYQYFEGLGESDLAPILVGVVNAPVALDRDGGIVRFDVTDISTRHRAVVGRLADRDTFPLVAERDEYAVLPLVFGCVKRSRAVQVSAGATAVLVRACGDSDTTLYVDDASAFPQGQTLRIRIENELMEGYFQGNRFFVSERGIDIVASSTVTRAVDIMTLEDSSLGGIENEYAVYYLRVTDPGGTTHYRNIVYYSAETHRLHYNHPIVYGGGYWTIPAGASYGITSWARPHPAGARVYHVLDGYVYILNDAPSKAVHRLEGYGRVFDEDALEVGTENQLDIEGYVPINPNHYTINLNDTTRFPSLGHAVTTATFAKNPKELYPRLRDNGLWADLDGVESEGDGTGSVVENPAEVIRTLLTRRLGLGEADLDTSSFDAAAADLAGFRMAFTLDRQVDGLHLCADLAFQSRCALLWDDGTARLSLLRNRTGDPALTIGAEELADGLLRMGRSDMARLASEVVARYRRGAEPRAVVLRDAGVEAAFGRRVRSLDLWAYQDRRMAVSVARFWLNRWKYLHEEVRLTTFLTSLALRRNDTVELDLAGHFVSGQRGVVTEIVHHPGSGEAGRMDAITLGLQMPVAAGCVAACETECESTGESGCLLQCEIEAESGCWQCETQCEALCELACTTEAELNCIIHDTDGGGDTGCGACETSCETGCEASCETGCEVACETGCEAACETGCETACETGCEASCETGCEVACETGCETVCETGCEIACEAGCEVSCETGCETACEAGCEVSCESTCEAGCEVSCETGCESACETGCETSCETGCETGAECASSASDAFNRSEDPLSNDGNWGGSEIGDAYTDGTYCRLPVDGSNPACAPIWQTPVCDAEQQAEMNIVSFDNNLSYGLILRNDSASGRGSNYWYGRTVGHTSLDQGQIDLFKCVGGSLTNEASTGFSSAYWGASWVKLTCKNLPTPGTVICQTDKGNAGDTDTDVPGSAGEDYVGMRLAIAGGETSGVYSVDNFSYIDL